MAIGSDGPRGARPDAATGTLQPARHARQAFGPARKVRLSQLARQPSNVERAMRVAIPIALGLVGSYAVNRLKLPDRWTPWFYAMTVVLAAGAFALEWRRESGTGRAATVADPVAAEANGGSDSAASPDLPLASRFRIAHTLTGAVLLVLAAALCAYVAAQDFIGSVAATADGLFFWTKVDFMAAPVAAGVAAIPVLWRGRGTLAATVMIPMVLVSWHSTVRYFEGSGYGSTGLGIGVTAFAMLSLVVNYAKTRSTSWALGRLARGAIIALGGLSVAAAIVSGAVSDLEFSVAYLPFVISFACVAVQAGWEPEEPARRGAGLAVIVFALVQVLFPLYISSNLPDDELLRNLLLIASLFFMLAAGFVATLATSRR